MEKTKSYELPHNFHDAVVRWGETYLPDYPLLLRNWEKFFPKEPQFQLCAYRECNMCGVIEVGENEGKPKYEQAGQMNDKMAAPLMKAIKAQASTEFGSIQQHQLTLSRAQSEQDQFWILRMMAEEMRHGYQMCSLLLEDDWQSVSDQSGRDMVEEILSMRTGTHVLGAFNVDFDSFVDNIVFCALIDRVGKYQLSMQKISSYKPMAESMPPMLREEAFHLAAGVVPLRRWVKDAVKDDAYITLDMIQKTLNKWFPRGLDMFGDERGGGTNVRFGFKPMKNAEAIQQYADEVGTLVRDLNLRYLRARFPDWSRDDAVSSLKRILEHGDTVDGMQREDLLRVPDVRFFRRRGVHAYAMYDLEGKALADIETYRRLLAQSLPSVTPAGRDFRGYMDLMLKVTAGEMKPDEAVPLLPNLSRVGGVCPCSRAVRWIADDAESTNGNGAPG